MPAYDRHGDHQRPDAEAGERHGGPSVFVDRIDILTLLVPGLLVHVACRPVARRDGMSAVLIPPKVSQVAPREVIERPAKSLPGIHDSTGLVDCREEDDHTAAGSETRCPSLMERSAMTTPRSFVLAFVAVRFCSWLQVTQLTLAGEGPGPPSPTAAGFLFWPKVAFRGQDARDVRTRPRRRVERPVRLGDLYCTELTNWRAAGEVAVLSRRNRYTDGNVATTPEVGQKDQNRRRRPLQHARRPLSGKLSTAASSRSIPFRSPTK